MAATEANDNQSSSTSDDSSKKTSKDVTAAAADTSKQQQQVAPPPPIFIHNLSISSPRQRPSSSLSNGSPNNSNEEEEVVIQLPPLRPEEPVASLRGALSEVIGFAHLTKYRLVVEKKKQSTTNNSPSSGKQSNDGKQQSGKQNSSNNKKKKQDNNNVVWSTYTLRNAVVSTPSTLQCLETDTTTVVSTTGGGGSGDKKEKEEEELVLDDYGDLSILLPLLQQQSDAADPNSTNNTNTTNNNTNNTNNKEATKEELILLNGHITPRTPPPQQILDASNYTIRIILEKYTISSIKDHVIKIRSMLIDGALPFVSSLVADVDESGESEGVVAEEVVKESEKVDEVEVEKKGDKSKDNDNNKEQTKEEQQELERIKQSQIAKQLPQYKSNYDLFHTSVTTNGDLSNFYYLACGEEQTLVELQDEEESSNGNGQGSGRKFSFEDPIVKVSDKQQQQNGSSDNKKKKNRKKKKNKNTNTAANEVSASSGSENETTTNTSTNQATTATTAVTTNAKYLLDIESQLAKLNAQSCISNITIVLSGYNPPPSHRSILGDLAYLVVTLPDSQVVHVTAIPQGFYINKSTEKKFDPTPDINEGSSSNNQDSMACYSHSLLDCLLQKSKSLRTVYTTALSASKQRSELLSLSSINESTLYNFFRPLVSPFSTNNLCGSNTSLVGGLLAGLVLNNNTNQSGTFSSRIDMVTVKPSWLVPPLPSVHTSGGGNGSNGSGGSNIMLGKKLETYNHSTLHEYSTNRLENELMNNNMYGMDIRGGGLRDWNEELQVARELSVDTFGERVDRARLVHKVLSDFGEAALAGVKAIFDGYILPMNPNESARAHVYLHNNIFFSRAVDTGLDTFKIIQGDAAAKKSASRDCCNMGLLHRLDIPGLHTLATVLVEYLGTRIICQSVVPGILHGEKSHKLLYGAVETLSALQCDDEMHDLLESTIGEGCMIATRKIPKHPLSDERMEFIKENRITPLPPPQAAVTKEQEDDDDDNKDTLVQACGPIEMKGILGSDQRKYVLDCTRLTPRDANWVSKDMGGTGKWEESLESSGAKSQELIPSTLDDDEWTACVIRRELITNYAETKIRDHLIKYKEEMESKTKTEEKKDDSAAAEDKADKADDKEWVDLVPGKKVKEFEKSDEEKVEEKKKESLLLAKVEDEYVNSLRYNVNVFLPYTRSIEGIDKASYETLMKDEEEARQLARYLWDTAIPSLTKEIRSGGGSGLQLPADGRALTEMIHQRGINCRYLGRLAELARKEELEDIISSKKAATAAALVMSSISSEADDKIAAAKQYKAPRFCMPICWLELLECEMVARAAKHVLDSYILENGNQPVAQTIASFLSAIMSVGEESAGETEVRMTNNPDQEEMATLTLDFGDDASGDDASSANRGRDEIWKDIEREVGRRFRYTLLLYNSTSSGSSKKGETEESRALYMPLLRRICQRSGIRLVAKQYDLGKKCVCGGSAPSYPIAPSDILDILPLVKHAASLAGESFSPCSFSGSSPAGSNTTLHILLDDVRTMHGIAQANLNNRNYDAVIDYAQEAAALYQRVLDSPLHPQITKCLRLTTIAHFQKNEYEHAVMAASKYLAITIALNGFDSYEVLQAHLTVADIYLEAGKIEDFVKHARSAQFLMEFLGGKNYAGIAPQYYRMGSLYYEAGKVEDAFRFFEAAASRRKEDRMFECLIARNTSGVLANLGLFRQAFEYEKKAYQSYLTFLGEDHDATKACMRSLSQILAAATEQEKQLKINEKERVKENAAESVANQIRADEEAREAKPKKKKNKNKKKGKK